MTNDNYKLPILTCLRCGHTWIPRTPKKPKVCPNLKCKSPYWDKLRRRRKGKRSVMEESFITLEEVEEFRAWFERLIEKSRERGDANKE